MFGTQENVEVLNASQILLPDGTYTTAPPLFPQVYCIHRLRGGPNPRWSSSSLFIHLASEQDRSNLCKNVGANSSSQPDS